MTISLGTVSEMTKGEGGPDFDTLAKIQMGYLERRTFVL